MALTSFLVIWLLVVIAYALEDPQEYNYSDHAASKCCSLITALTASKSQARSPTALNGVIACLNQSISSIYRFVQQANVPYTASPTPKQGPSRAIAVITRITPEIYSYAAYSTFLQIHWAQRQGYSYIPFMDTYDANKERRKGYNDDYRYHRKLTLILEVLKVPSVYRDIDEYGKSRGEKVCPFSLSLSASVFALVPYTHLHHTPFSSSFSYSFFFSSFSLYNIHRYIEMLRGCAVWPTLQTMSCGWMQMPYPWTLLME